MFFHLKPSYLYCGSVAYLKRVLSLYIRKAPIIFFICICVMYHQQINQGKSVRHVWILRNEIQFCVCANTAECSEMKFSCVCTRMRRNAAKPNLFVCVCECGGKRQNVIHFCECEKEKRSCLDAIIFVDFSNRNYTSIGFSVLSTRRDLFLKFFT